MTAHSVPVLIKDQYRIVAVTMDEEGDQGPILGYALFNSAGVRLRHALTLDDAKALLERFIDEDNPAPPVVLVPPTSRHVRR